jgi:hypothetical protein
MAQQGATVDNAPTVATPGGMPGPALQTGHCLNNSTRAQLGAALSAAASVILDHVGCFIAVPVTLVCLLLPGLH